MTSDALYDKPLTLAEIGFCQRMRVPLWCSWSNSEIFINKTWWRAQHPKVQETVAKLLKEQFLGGSHEQQ